MNAINRGECVAALVVGAIGLAIVWIGSDYAVGTPRRIGPGFFPLAIGALLLMLSVGLVFEALRAERRSIEFQARPFLLVMAALASFAVFMERIGLVPATICLVVLSALAETPFRPLRTLLLALAVSAMGVLIFVYALGLPLKSFTW
ncbi:tripartite tricarboxylate transporter TctB family protein [Oricola sp.]|uniref:tripartite tricarboxylate transporter TctB family protein n=1 Tax=Oricola sp. TaxID=1979950 RepID=UPI0025D6051E|nr:tripartite tricarboxylate transporter TctB family protein [Oricola sp.]MCI5075077.1 tripartite tricarboxylate transporter TctB family protein [Oricola sp.]